MQATLCGGNRGVLRLPRGKHDVGDGAVLAAKGSLTSPTSSTCSEQQTVRFRPVEPTLASLPRWRQALWADVADKRSWTGVSTRSTLPVQSAASLGVVCDPVSQGSSSSIKLTNPLLTKPLAMDGALQSMEEGLGAARSAVAAASRAVGDARLALMAE